MRKSQDKNKIKYNELKDECEMNGRMNIPCSELLVIVYPQLTNLKEPWSRSISDALRNMS